MFNPRSNCHSETLDFIKLDYSIDNGMPFTIGKYIFISDNLFKRNISNIIFHEQIHIHQHFNSNKYRHLYNKLGFNKININLDNIFNIMTNPDGMEYYIYHNKYIPLLIINNNKLKSIIYDITNNNIIDINYFKQMYNIKSSAYHPDEIIAEYLTTKYY